MISETIFDSLFEVKHARPARHGTARTHTSTIHGTKEVAAVSSVWFRVISNVRDDINHAAIMKRSHDDVHECARCTPYLSMWHAPGVERERRYKRIFWRVKNHFQSKNMYDTFWIFFIFCLSSCLFLYFFCLSFIHPSFLPSFLPSSIPFQFNVSP